MGLTLVLGRAGSGKTYYCYREIREELIRAPEGPPLYLILPEQATYQAERELAESLPGQGFFRAQVLGFRRFAYRVLQEAGGALAPQLSELGKRLIIYRLLKEHRNKLKVFGRAAAQRGFAGTLAGMFKEFKAYRLTPELLAALPARLGAEPPADKLADLGLLYRAFSGAVAGRYSDAEDYLALLPARIPASGLLQGARVWLDGFSWFNPREFDIIEAMLRTGTDVTVTLTLDGREASDPMDLFHRQWETRRKLRDIATRTGAKAAEKFLGQENAALGENMAPAAGDETRFRRPLLAHIERTFGALPAAAWKGEGEAAGIVVAEAANRRAEVEGMARDILRLAREEGYRWRDIAVLLPDPENYADLVPVVLADYAIPFFSDRKRPAAHHPVGELLAAALDLVRYDWDYEAVFRCLKTDLFAARGISRDDVDQLENYVLEFGIRGESRWISGEPWQFRRRWSLEEDSGELDAAQQEYLEKINEVRCRVARPLAAFAGMCRTAATAGGIAEALRRLLEDLGVPGLLEVWTEEARSAGDPEAALEHRQAWQGINSLLDQMAAVCGDEPMSLDDFAEIFAEGLAGLEFSLVPPSLDHVMVSSLEQTKIANIRAVYVPGAADGVLPPRRRTEGILSDAERARLAECGVELAPGAAADGFSGQFLVYTALTRARDYLWLSYPLADGEGHAVSASPAVRWLREAAGGLAVRPLSLEPLPGQEREFVARPRQAVAVLAASLRQGAGAAPEWRDVYNWALASPAGRMWLDAAMRGFVRRNREEPLPGPVAERLFCGRRGRLRGSVTRLETFRACPFRHFARYGLGLKERAVRRLAPPDLGQLLHAVLRRFGERVREEGLDWAELAPERAAAMAGAIAAELAPSLQNEILLSSAGYVHLAGRLRRTAERVAERIAAFARMTRFRPVRFEQGFGEGPGSWPAYEIVLPGGTVCEFTGQIDRLDEAELDGRRYILIVDYKSGAVRLNLLEVFHGLKLQLLAYLLAAAGMAAGEPAGVLYYSMRVPVITAKGPEDPAKIAGEIRRRMKMTGWLLDTPEIARLLDTAQGWSEFFPVQVRGGSLSGSAAGSSLRTPEELAAVARHVENVIREAAAGILAGDIAIAPYLLKDKTACGYCPYFPVCQFDRLEPDNEYRRLPAPDEGTIWKRLLAGKEEKEGQSSGLVKRTTGSN